MNEKKILIAGGGGFGLELWTYLTQDIASGRMPGYVLAGLLNDWQDCDLLNQEPAASYIGTIKDYSPQPDECVLIAVGSVLGRRKIADIVRSRGGRLFTYVHSSVLVAPSAKIGEGSVICANSIINAGSSIGRNVVVNFFCNIGHGASIADDCVLSPYCALSGNSALGDGGFMGTRATLFPWVRLGEACVVDAHSAVRQSAGDAQIISTRGQYVVQNNRFAPMR